MNLYAVIAFLVIIIVLVLIYRWYIKDKTELIVDWNPAMGRKVLSKIEINNSPNYTFSVWIYLKNWNQTKNEKLIFQRYTGTHSNSLKGSSELYSELLLGAESPEIIIRIKGDNNITVPRIPLQRWVHVLYTIQSSIMDVYIDGKLIKHAELKSLETPPSDTTIAVFGTKTHHDTIQGKISKLEYIRKFISPQRAWDIYVDGPKDSSIFGTWLNRYMLRIQWMKDGKVEHEYKI